MIEHKRIAFVCHPYHRGGVTRWMADAAIAFAHQGWDVYFITVAPSVVFFSGKGRETLLRLLQKENAGIHTLSVPVGREFEFGTTEYKAYIYRKLLLQLPPGSPVILSDDPAVWQAAASLYSTFPMVGVLHADEAYYYSLATKYFRQLSILVCVSERVKMNTIKQIPGIDASKIYTIPCGINLPGDILSGHAGDILQLVYVGRISEYQKRVSDLVKVCAQLHQLNKAFHLNIIGDGDEKAMLVDNFDEAGLVYLVTFRGWLSQKDVSMWLATSDILILTSDFEGTPVAMMEALAAGCGITGTRVSGIEDYELHLLAADCFALFDVGDIEGAISGIAKIAAVPVSIRQQSARALAEAEFSMPVCIERYINAVQTVTSGNITAAINVKMPVSAILYSRIVAALRYLKISISRA